jgi:hypothetical protein
VVAGTHTAREAWEAEPELVAAGEGSIQNIRKRAKRITDAEDDAAEVLLQLQGPGPAAKPVVKPPVKKQSVLPKGKRLRTDQVDAILVEAHARTRRRVVAHKEATAELAASQLAGTSHGSRATPAAIAQRASDKHALSPGSILTAKGISRFVADGRAGESPLKPGPQSKVPKELTFALGARAQLLQLTGQEQSPRKLLAAAMAAMAGTDFEGVLDSKAKRNKLTRMIKAVCPELETKRKKVADDRRVEWLCRSRLIRWFLGYITFLKDKGFILIINTYYYTNKKHITKGRQPFSFFSSTLSQYRLYR